jgi:hypothetical protein
MANESVRKGPVTTLIRKCDDYHRAQVNDDSELRPLFAEFCYTGLLQRAMSFLPATGD